MKQFPDGKEFRIAPFNGIDPLACWYFVVPESLIFPSSPLSEGPMPVLPHRSQGLRVEVPIVVHPSSNDGIIHFGKIFETEIACSADKIGRASCRERV